MQVTKGYKQTEAGVIPEDWNVAPINEVFQFKQGVQTPIEEQFKMNGSGLVRFIRIIDLTENSEPPRYIRDPGRPHHLVGTDLFMVRYGTPGLIGYGFNGVIANNLFRLIPKQKIDPNFYMHYLGSKYKEIEQLSGSSTMPAINFSILGKLEIPIPTKAEQGAIAEALSDTDAWIESLEQLIAKKRRIKAGSMQSLLTGKQRLPGFSGEWEVKTLGDVLKIGHGRSQHAVEKENGQYPILATGGEIGRASEYLYNKPTVLIGRKGTINKPQYMDTPFWSVDTLFYSIIKESNCAKFLYYRFCLIDWMQHNEASGVPSLNAKTIESIEVNIPVPAEQTAIATILSDMDSELNALEAKLSKARQIKQGMMQELLTGKTRLV